MSHTQLLADLTRVPRVSAFVKVSGSATDDLQVCNSREVGDYFILDAGCEKGVLLVIAKVIEWQHRDALLSNVGRGGYSWGRGAFMRAIPQEKENTRHEEGDNGENGEPDSNIAPAPRSCRNRRDSFDFRWLVRRDFGLGYFSRR